MPSILPSIPRRLLPALLTALVLAGCATTETKVVPVDDQQLATTLAGKKKYEFRVHWDGSLIDANDHQIEPDAIPAYLNQTKPDKDAYFVLWLVDEAAAPGARKDIPKFQAYGATRVVVRVNKQVGPVAANPEDEKSKKMLYLVGKQNPHAIGAKDPMPDLSGRPAELRPGKLPPPVRYKFASDAEVIRGADLVRGLFISPTNADPATTFDKIVMVNPGAWARLRSRVTLASAKPLSGKVPLRGGRTLTLEGRLVQTAEDHARTVSALRRLIAEEGGAELHALSSVDMAQWWPFIGFDIEEPVFVLETKSHACRFIVCLLHDKLFLLDDLNALPPI